jgi:hypothetical protein
VPPFGGGRTKQETLNQKILMKISFGKTLNSTFSPINVDATL